MSKTAFLNDLTLVDAIETGDERESARWARWRPKTSWVRSRTRAPSSATEIESLDAIDEPSEVDELVLGDSLGLFLHEIGRYPLLTRGRGGRAGEACRAR